MTRRLCLAPLAAALLMTPVVTATASADRIAVQPRPQRVRRPMPLPRPARYKVDLIGEHARQLQAFRRRGATYILGSRGQRYAIRIHNPTSRRVEAVVSVDGLDVIDGQSSNYRKRGYVIPAHGQVTIDGFRTSMSQVAAFRFSSVSNSYAARKGKPARVGVILVALFDESVPMIIRRPVYKPYPRRRYRHYNKRPSRSRPSTGRSGSKSTADVRSVRRPTRPGGYRPQPRPPRKRPGLGTRFGERRQSSVRYTTFKRRSAWAPNRVITLRYNNRSGLVAMGILPGRGLQLAR